MLHDSGMTTGGNAIDAWEWKQCLTLLADPDVSEVEANGPAEFFIKKKGKRIRLDEIALESDERYTAGIEQGLVRYVKKIIDYKRNSYIFEGPLSFRAGGQIIRGRVHIVLPPAADRPQVTIAKKSTSLISLDAIAGRGSMSTEMLRFLKAAIEASMTIVLSGGTGAGKTTMLEACTKLIPSHVRIGVAEDSPELDLPQENVTYLHSVPWRPGMDPNDVATLSWVVQQFQRMRTDRLIIGETRGKEFADFLVAANSGMEGSMTTLHANTPARALDKMTNFAMRGSDGLSARAINSDIANAIDVVVQLVILPDGRHKVAEITEVTNTIGNGEDARITTNTIFRYDPGTDKFLKVNNPGDKMRSLFRDKEIDITSVSPSPAGTVMPPHADSSPLRSPQANRTLGGGLPIPGTRTV